MNKGIEATAKTILKASLVITGASTWALGPVETNIGDLAIVQFFGTLNIAAVVIWEWMDQHSRLIKSK